MKILYLGKNDEKLAASAMCYLRHALAKIEDVAWYGPGYGNFRREKFLHILEVVQKRFNFEPIIELLNYLTTPSRDIFRIIEQIYGKDEPDFIIQDVYWPPCYWKNLDKVKIPKAIIWGDLHHDPLGSVVYVNQNKFDLVLFVYKNSPLRTIYSDRTNCPSTWLPWSVNTNVFKDYGLERKYDVTCLGSMNPYVYPMRAKMVDVLSRRSDINFFTQKHPGYGWNLDPKKHLIRENYARVISQSKIFAFDTGIFNGALIKFFEGMACNTLVMAPMPYDGEELHFEPGYNFVDINEHNFLENILYYLKHEDERLEIAKRGYETVRKYHTVEIRAKQLVDSLKKIAK